MRNERHAREVPFLSSPGLVSGAAFTRRRVPTAYVVVALTLEGPRIRVRLPSAAKLVRDEHAA